MEYNTTRNFLVMAEYGRNIQKMVEHLLTIEDKEKRQENAMVVIELMGTLNPHLRNVEDFRHKLWDHLFLISDFKLQVDSPYPIPTRESLKTKPETLPYPKRHPKLRHFGKNLEMVIDKALKESDEDKREGFTQCIGNYMKLAYTNWHKEPVHDDMIKNELAELSNGLLVYETGGYKVHFDNRPNFKQNRNNNNNNRNYKGNQGNNNRNYGGGNGGGGSYNKNRNNKFNKNKNK